MPQFDAINRNWAVDRSIADKTRRSVNYITALLFNKLKLMEEIFADKCNRRYTLLFYSGYRSLKEQAELYLKGRTGLQIQRLEAYYASVCRIDIWNMISGLAMVSRSGGVIVTNAPPGKSAHQYGLACDGVPLYNGQAIWDENVNTPNDSKYAIWKMYGDSAAECGLEWGGNWKNFKETPHVQLPINMSWDALMVNGIDLLKMQ